MKTIAIIILGIFVIALSCNVENKIAKLEKTIDVHENKIQFLKMNQIIMKFITEEWKQKFEGEK